MVLFVVMIAAAVPVVWVMVKFVVMMVITMYLMGSFEASFTYLFTATSILPTPRWPTWTMRRCLLSMAWICIMPG